MMLTRNDIRKIVKLSIVSIFILTILGYALFTSHDLLLGPEIILKEPIDTYSFATSSVTIAGTAKRAQNVILNDKSITMDENGNFREVSLLAKGYNVFILKVEDRLKRQKEYRLEFINTLK